MVKGWFVRCELIQFQKGLNRNVCSLSSIQVSAFSTWDKELHKIVFDPRYLLLNPKERKQVHLHSPFTITFTYAHPVMGNEVKMSLFQVFDQYVKTRAEEERKEKKNKLMHAKDEFRRMMEEARLTTR